MERTNCDFIMHDLWTLIWCGTQKYWKRKKAWLLQWTPPSFVGSDCLSQRFCGDCLTIILFSFMMTQGVLSWGSQWICYNLAVDDTCQRLLPSWPQASWLGTLLSYDSHNTTTLVTSHCPGPEGHLNEGVGGIWLGKWLKRSLCCNFPHCSRKLKPEQGMLKKPVLHLWEMKWKVPSLLLRVKSCVLESCSYFRWGEGHKAWNPKRNVIYLLLNDSAGLFWNAGQGECWNSGCFGISIPLEVKNWATLGATCTFIFQDVNYFIINLYCNQKWLVFSYVRVITCTLFIRQAFTEHFRGVEFSSHFSAGTEIWPDVQRRWKELPVSPFMLLSFYLGKNISIWNGSWIT